jgi:hypothetical protein
METYTHQVGDTITLSLLIADAIAPMSPMVNDATVYLAIQRQADDYWLNFSSNEFDENGPGNNYKILCNNINNLYQYIFDHAAYDVTRPNSYLIYFTATIDDAELIAVEEHNFLS